MALEDGIAEVSAAVTTGMKDAGFYDRHSTPQWNSIAAVLPWLEEALGRWKAPGEPAAIVCADFGCSEGRNSIAAMQRIVAALRRRMPQPIQTVHSDLPTNNFNQLQQNLSSGGRSAFSQPSVYSASVGGSMYEQLLPPQSVSLATTFNSLGWLSRVPADVARYVLARKPRRARGGVGVADEVVAAFAAQAREDATKFYAARAAEIVPGGLLLVATFGAGPVRSVIDGIYDAFNDALLETVGAGEISEAIYEKFVMPLYMRQLDELTGPVTDANAPAGKLFRVLRAETMEIPIELNLQFAQSGDAAVWASGCANFLRAFSEPVLKARMVEVEAQEGLSGKPSSLDARLDSIYRRVEGRLMADPQGYEFSYIQVAALLERI